MEKSANKRWKESGTSLSFKQWIERENQKKESLEKNYFSFDAQQTISDSIAAGSTAINEFTPQNNQPTVNRGKVLGLDRNILLFSTLVIVGSLGYLAYTRLKNKK